MTSTLAAVDRASALRAAALAGVASGAVFAVATVSGLAGGSEGTLALGLLAAVALLAPFAAPRSPIRAAAVGGSLAGLIGVGAQAALFDLYLRNNPQYAETVIPFGLTARAWTTLGAPVAALAGCIVAAACTAVLVGARRILHDR